MIFIRPADYYDKARVLSLARQVRGNDDHILTDWDCWFKEKNHFLIAATTVDGRIVGFRHLTFFENYVWADALRVHPQFRLQNIATSMIQFGSNEAKKRGIERVRGAFRPFHRGSIETGKSAGYNTYLMSWYLFGAEQKNVGNYNNDSFLSHCVQLKDLDSIVFNLKKNYAFDFPFYGKGSVGYPLDRVSLTKFIQSDHLLSNANHGSFLVYEEREETEKGFAIREISVFGDPNKIIDQLNVCFQKPFSLSFVGLKKKVLVYLSQSDTRIQSAMAGLGFYPLKSALELPLQDDSKLVDLHFVILEKQL